MTERYEAIPPYVAYNHSTFGHMILLVLIVLGKQVGDACFQRKIASLFIRKVK